VFVSDRAGVENMYSRLVGGNADERLLVSERANYPMSMARDGTLAFVSVKVGQAQDLWVLHPDQKEKPVPWLETAFSEGGAAFSPDGRWLAYASNESGRYEVFVQSFPNAGGRWQISKDGAVHPRWRGDSKELFYYASDGRLMAVPIKGDTAIEAGAPVPLFAARMLGGPAVTLGLKQQYDVTRDGQRFLLLAPVGEEKPASTAVVVNWMSALQKSK
jgi:Tol biopolymer transport system component